MFGDGDTLIIRTLAPLRSPAARPQFDAALQLRMQALQELARSRATGDAFRALREVVLDPRQPSPLRQSAVYSLGTLRRPETGPFLLEIARSDAARGLAAFGDRGLCTERTGTREGCRGTDRPVQTLQRDRTAPMMCGSARRCMPSPASAMPAPPISSQRSHARIPNDDIRNSAVFYLGSMGTDRSRAALIRLLRGE